MVIKPRFRDFICTTSHPSGCAANVRTQIEYVRKQPRFEGPKKVLVIGASTGFGLSSRITAAFGGGAATVGVFLERPAFGTRTASAGWYNTAAFEEEATKAGLYSKSICGDAFSHEVKNMTVDRIKADLGQVDLVIYSIASPKRIHPDTGEAFNSVLKPIGTTTYENITVDFHTKEVKPVAIAPAVEKEITDTIAVMGGEDWEMWINALEKGGVLAPNCTTVAYSYIGPEITRAIYREGTIGGAKDHLEKTGLKLDERMKKSGGRAFVSVNKALVTQASSAIPVVLLYTSLLYKVMREKGIHEGCIEQMYRMFTDRLYSGDAKVDATGRIRVDDWELRPDVQQAIADLWIGLNTETLADRSDIDLVRTEFFRLFGFDVPGIDYEADVNAEIEIPGLISQTM